MAAVTMSRVSRASVEPCLSGCVWVFRVGMGRCRGRGCRVSGAIRCYRYRERKRFNNYRQPRRLEEGARRPPARRGRRAAGCGESPTCYNFPSRVPACTLSKAGGSVKLSVLIRANTCQLVLIRLPDASVGVPETLEAVCGNASAQRCTCLTIFSSVKV